ncbi:putative DNA polymerase V/Myb-binding protein 1A [Plasmopara halstedii]
MAGKQQDGNDSLTSHKGDFLKLFYTLAESERNVRTQAALQLISYLQSSDKQETEVQYTLKRLVRGLASSRDAARQGFSTALSALLTVFPLQLDLQTTYDLLCEAMEVHSSMKPMEQREHMFGRLFGLLALHRSGRLPTNLPLLVTIIKELLEMATFKRWFREACYDAVLTLLVDVPIKEFMTELVAPIHKALEVKPVKINKEDRSEIWNADQVLLAVGVQRYMQMTGLDQDEEQMKLLPIDFKARNAVERRNVHVLAQPLRGTSGCYPRVHLAWIRVFDQVLNMDEGVSIEIDEEYVKEAWTVLVENSLVGSSSVEDNAPTSHERQGLAFKLFELLVLKLPTSILSTILTPRFVKCLYNNSVLKRNYLYEAARHCLKTFAKCAPGEFFHFIREQFTSPLSKLVSSTSFDSDDEDEEPMKKQKRSAEGFDALLELEEKREREEAMKRRTDRARVWAVDLMVTALLELLNMKGDANGKTAHVQDDVFRFLVFHSFFTLSSETEIKKKSKKAKKKKISELDDVAQNAAAITPGLSKSVVNYIKMRLYALLSLGLTGADGARPSASVLSRIFAFAQEMQHSCGIMMLREPLSKETSAQLSKLVNCVDALRCKEMKKVEEEEKTAQTAVRRPLCEAFLLLFMSTGLQLLDAEQRKDALVVASDLESCYAQLEASKEKSSLKKKNKKNAKTEEIEMESVVVLTDLLLSLLSQNSSALREIVSQAFRSLVPLLNSKCLTTMINVLQPPSEEGIEEDDDEFAPITPGEDEEEEEEDEVMLSSSDALSDALRNDKKLSALHQEDLALAAIVGQVKVRSQRKKEQKLARLQTMHFQLRVVDLLQVFVSKRPEQTEAAITKHNTLVISLIVPLFSALARVQTADEKQLVLRDRLLAVLLNKILRVKDKIPSSVEAQTEALNALRQLIELIRTRPMDKNYSGKVASAAVVYLVRVICTGEADEAVQGLLRTAVLDAFTKKHSRFPRAAFEELVNKCPAIGARVLLEPLAAVAAATEKDNADEKEVRPAVDEFSKCEVFRLLTFLLRGITKVHQSEDVPKAQQDTIEHVQKSFKTALVRQFAPESVHQLKAKRLKVVLTFALQLIKFWRLPKNQKATESDVQDVVAAVQAMDTKSPAIKSLMKNVLIAAGVPFVTQNSIQADLKVANGENLEKKISKSSKETHKKKRKRSIGEMV